MEEQRPDLRVIEGGLSKNNVDKISDDLIHKENSGERQNFLSAVRKKLLKFIKKIDTNPENIPPTGKAF